MTKKTTITCLVNDQVAMESGFWGEHGLSFLIETPEQTVLFDTGTSPTILEHNLKVLQKNLKAVSHIILSHGHYDHTGSLDWVLEQVEKPLLISDPATFDPKYVQSERYKSDKMIGSPMNREQVEQRAQLHVTVEPYKINERLTVTGWIPRRTSFEATPKNYVVEQDGKLVSDQLLDDRSLLLEVEQGMVVICGCCHAGLINLLDYVQENFERPIYAVVGGIHLVNASQERIDKTLASLRGELCPEKMYLNHCTGDEAYHALKREFGTRVKPFFAGDSLEYL